VEIGGGVGAGPPMQGPFWQPEPQYASVSPHHPCELQHKLESAHIDPGPHPPIWQELSPGAGQLVGAGGGVGWFCTGLDVTGAGFGACVVGATGVDVAPSEQPVVEEVTAATGSDQPLSSACTQKKAPPLQGCSTFRSDMTAAAALPFGVLKPKLQPEMHQPNTTDVASPAKISLTSVV